MMEQKKTKIKIENQTDWHRLNWLYLEKELAFLKLMLQRRMLWLRTQWKQDPMNQFHGQVISDEQVDVYLSSDDWQKEQTFYNKDSEAVSISQDLDGLAHELENESKAMWDIGMPFSLDVLTQMFDLSIFERAVLFLCFAPELDPPINRLYAYLQDDVTSPYVTPYLALSLFASDGYSRYFYQGHFLYNSPLFRYKLIQSHESTPLISNFTYSTLKIEKRISDFIFGINNIEEKIAPILKQLPVKESFPNSYGSICRKITLLIEKCNGQYPMPVINFTGSAKLGKRDIGSKLCDDLGMILYQLDLNRLYSSKLCGQDILSLIQRECMLLQSALYIDISELKDKHDSMVPVVDLVMDHLETFFMIGSTDPVELERNCLVFPIEKLNKVEQSTLWKNELSAMASSVEERVGDLVEQFDFESDTIAKAVNRVKTKSLMESDDTVDPEFNDLWSVCREMSQNNLSGLGQNISSFYQWEDIVLPIESSQMLIDIAAQVNNRAIVYEDWGFGTKLNRGRGISALFSGPSGTGKTMAAEILSNDLKLDLYRIDLSSVMSKYIGETEKNLKRVFDAAEKSSVILFFDEADALFGKRSEVKDSHDRYANIEINYLLQRMEEYRGLAILATNMKSLLDPAFLRRIRFHVDFPFPNGKNRKIIWQKSFPVQARVGSLDYDFLSGLEITGGNIKNIVLNAAFLAAADVKMIEMNHLLCAIKREYAKIGKMLLESEFGKYYDKVLV